MTLAV